MIETDLYLEKMSQSRGKPTGCDENLISFEEAIDLLHKRAKQHKRTLQARVRTFFFFFAPMVYFMFWRILGFLIIRL